MCTSRRRNDERTLTLHPCFICACPRRVADDGCRRCRLRRRLIHADVTDAGVYNTRARHDVPSPAPAPAPPPAPITVNLTGNVRSVSGLRLGGATVTVLDGANSGRTATADGNGAYRIADMQIANGNLVARAGGFFEDRRGIFVDGTSTLDFVLRANFSGRWPGQVRSTSCSDDGVLDGFCNEFPSLSTDVVLKLTQTDSAVTGTIRLAAAPTIKASGQDRNVPVLVFCSTPSTSALDRHIAR